MLGIGLYLTDCVDNLTGNVETGRKSPMQRDSRLLFPDWNSIHPSKFKRTIVRWQQQSRGFIENVKTD